MNEKECLKFAEFLYDYADELLDAPQRLKVEEHCAKCADCSSIVAEIRMVTQAALELPLIEPPADKMWLEIQSLINSKEKVVSSKKEPIVNPFGIVGGFFSSVYSQVKNLRIVAVPVLVTAFVLLAIFPFWIPEGTNPLLPDYVPPSDLKTDQSLFIESDSLGLAMSEASSEARWDLLEDAFSDVLLDQVASDGYSGWKIK